MSSEKTQARQNQGLPSDGARIFEKPEGAESQRRRRRRNLTYFSNVFIFYVFELYLNRNHLYHYKDY